MKDTKMTKIILTVTNNLESDQRVNKVATSLHKFGYEVKVVGCKSRPCKPYQKEYATERLNVFFKRGVLFYAEINIRFFFHLLFADADVFTANDTDALAGTYLAAKLRGKSLVVDLHELFPEVPEVTNRKFVKGVWTKIEDWILPKVKHGYTVCQSIADYYKNRYGVNLGVVRNMPSYKSLDDIPSTETHSIPLDKKIILYQGAVNVGRGVEWIIDAMPYVREDAIFVVAGKGDLYEELKTKANDRIIFLGHIPYAELASITKHAAIGVCLLKNQGLSYYYALPNRVFDMIQCHVPLLATDFPEIRRIVATHETGKLISDYSPKALAETINSMLDEPIDHDKFSRLAEELCWEKEEEKLKAIYEAAVRRHTMSSNDKI